MEVDVTELAETENSSWSFGVEWWVGRGRGKIIGGSGVKDAKLVGEIESGTKKHPVIAVKILVYTGMEVLYQDKRSERRVGSTTSSSHRSAIR